MDHVKIFGPKMFPFQ